MMPWERRHQEGIVLGDAEFREPYSTCWDLAVAILQPFPWLERCSSDLEGCPLLVALRDGAQ